MINPRYSNLLFSLLLSGMMSFLVSGISTLRTVPLDPDFVGVWMASWISSWAVAFPAVIVVAPLARRMVARLTATSGK
ncbi:DUF2798 domain-containing protein [Meridianimarinicoccus roseus]|jgi:hypothetical protein|uniref:DUF2798 domain-containing protein n=1 Tax=Meridianimarinicoccus roseus TaxID=2072018 RepID=A0A2V2LKZ3_9RHOB|nr:DUF2798 domain-containing protein [Meridianimarinicoccus roseus]PWR03866.1 DUF2798 domain-containing protein [Meridianimarinicoccus roseus]